MARNTRPGSSPSVVPMLRTISRALARRQGYDLRREGEEDRRRRGHRLAVDAAPARQLGRGGATALGRARRSARRARTLAPLLRSSSARARAAFGARRRPGLLSDQGHQPGAAHDADAVHGAHSCSGTRVTLVEGEKASPQDRSSVPSTSETPRTRSEPQEASAAALPRAEASPRAPSHAAADELPAEPPPLSRARSPDWADYRKCGPPVGSDPTQRRARTGVLWIRSACSSVAPGRRSLVLARYVNFREA